MKQEDKGKSAEDLFYDAMGCGCCTSGNDPKWEDVESALREQIAQEIEAVVIEFAGDSAKTMEKAARIARGNVSAKI